MARKIAIAIPAKTGTPGKVGEKSKKGSRPSSIAEMMVQFLTLQRRATDPSNPGLRLSAQGALAKSLSAAVLRDELGKWAMPHIQINPTLNASTLVDVLKGDDACEWKKFVKALSPKDRKTLGKSASELAPPANVRKHLAAIAMTAKVIKTSRKRQS
jgi:hypothetical protein